MRFLKAGIISATVAAIVALTPSAAWAFKYERLPPMVSNLTPMTEYDPPLYIPGRVATGGGTFGDTAKSLFRHPGVLQCFGDGGAVLVESSGHIGCWAGRFPERHGRISGRWPSGPADARAAARAFAKCVRRDAISLTVIRGTLACIDTPREVLRLSAEFHSKRPDVRPGARN